MSIPKHSMSAIYYAYIGVVWGVNVGMYGIHGVSGIGGVGKHGKQSYLYIVCYAHVLGVLQIG